jgi:hypothetical protein
MIVDSKQKILNIGEIVAGWLQDNPQSHPDKVIFPAIIAELAHPNVEIKQFGNTLFELIKGHDRAAYFKAFNVDTAPNFVSNAKLFLLWTKHIHGLQNIITRFQDPAIVRIVQAVFRNPPSGMTYKLSQVKTGEVQMIINLGR